MRAAALLLVLALLAACGSSSDAASSDAPSSPKAWPQPVDGKLTTEMCDLLTPDDYSKHGATGQGWSDRRVATDWAPNAVICEAPAGGWLTLNLQPDSVSASLFLKSQLIRQKQEIERYGSTSQLQEDVLAEADESWTDVSADQPSRELHVRRAP